MGRRALTAEEREYGARLGQWVAERRRRAGLSAPDLAQKSGVSVDEIRSIETGRVANPGFRIVAALVASLNASTDALSRHLSPEPRRTK